MHRKNKWILLTTFFLFFTLLICGCWSRKELETLAFVTTVGIDKAEEPGKIEVTLQMVDTTKIRPPGGGGGGGEEKPVLNMKKTGLTLFEAIRKFNYESTRRPFFPHCQAVIYGEEIAREGVGKYIDFIDRDPELRRNLYVLVAKGEASKILEGQPPLEYTVGVSINRVLDKYSTTSQIIPIDLQEFIERLMSKTTAPVAPIVLVNKEKNISVTGTAVFKEDKMVGELTPRETRGLLWVLNKAKGGIIAIQLPHANENISIEVINSQCKIIPEIKDNKLKVTVEIREEGNLGELNSPHDFANEKGWDNIEKLTAGVIHGEVLAAFKKAQEFNADIFGFGEAFYRKYPAVWREIKDDWDKHFANLELTIKVESNIRESGLVFKSSMPR